MRTGSEYQGLLMSEADSALSRPVGTERDVNAAVAEARRRVTAKRNQLTDEISKLWKEGFKTLKEENDMLQKALQVAHRSVDIMIVERRNDMYEGVQK